MYQDKKERLKVKDKIHIVVYFRLKFFKESKVVKELAA
jgi:hypothetical protein